jgi:hypothetical protein
MTTQMFCPPFATSLPQSENKVASTQSKGLVKHGWKAHGGQEKVEQSSFNEKQESKQSQKATPNLWLAAAASKASPKWPQLSPRDLSKMVGMHMEARREWNDIVSMKNRSQSSYKKNRHATKNAYSCPEEGTLPLSKSFWFGSLVGPLPLCDNGGFGFIFVSEKIFFNTFIIAESTVSTFTNNTIELKVSKMNAFSGGVLRTPFGNIIW